MPVRVYRWDDAGAPQLGAASSLVPLLERVLVDGYGSKPGLGWAKLKSSSGKVAAFRPAARAAARPWLLIDDRTTASQYGVDCRGAALVRCVDGLTSIADDATLNAEAVISPTYASVAAQELFWAYRDSTGKTYPWLIVADNDQDWLWFFRVDPATGDASTSPGGWIWIPQVLGSLPPLNSNDSRAFVLPVPLGRYASAAADRSGDAANCTTMPGLAWGGGTLDANAGPRFYNDVAGFYPGEQAVLVGHDFSAAGFIRTPNVISNALWLLDAGQLATSRNGETNMVRAWLRGAHLVLNDAVWRLGINALVPISYDVAGLAGRQLLPLPIRYSPSPSAGVRKSAWILIDTTGPWA